MSTHLPLWRQALAASDEALEGREFDSLALVDRVMVEAFLRAVARWLHRRGHREAAVLIWAGASQARLVTPCDDPVPTPATGVHTQGIGGEAARPAGHHRVST
jgi:hypothetical protein